METEKAVLWRLPFHGCTLVIFSMVAATQAWLKISIADRSSFSESSIRDLTVGISPYYITGSDPNMYAGQPFITPVTFTSCEKLERAVKKEIDCDAIVTNQVFVGLGAALSVFTFLLVMLCGTDIFKDMQMIQYIAIGSFSLTAILNAGYLTFQKYLLKKLQELGYFITFEDEYLTSQKFPILGHQTNLSGDNGIRIKYCRQVKVDIHRG